MRKTLLTALLLFTATLQLTAQDYIPLIDNTLWSVRVYYFSGSQDIFYGPGTDETVNGQTYRHVTNVPMSANGVYIREDVAERKVYRLKDNQEELLYDFTLQQDDVIMLNNQQYTVTNRDSVAVMTGRKRVRIRLVHFAGSMAMGSETWIEGVGNPTVPLVPEYELLSDPAYRLICSNTNGDPVYNNGLVNTGTPSQCPDSSMNAEEFIADTISIWPNPLQTHANISSGSGFDNAIITVYNTTGKLIKEYRNVNGKEFTIRRDDLSLGLYFFQVIQENRETMSGKILVVN